MGKPMKMAINVIICHLLFRVKYQNLTELENLKRGVICPNHTNIFDPFFIYPKTDNLHIMAKAEIFKNKLLAKLFLHYNVFPVDRNKVDVKSTLTATNIFKENTGNVQFLIFPEGKVIKKNEPIGKVRNGAVFVAGTENVPILPVYISRNVRPFRKITVTFGKPMEIDKEILESKDKIREKSKELLDNIYKLKEEQDERKNI